jgi:hypothetical protein
MQDSYLFVALSILFSVSTVYFIVKNKEAGLKIEKLNNRISYLETRILVNREAVSKLIADNKELSLALHKYKTRMNKVTDILKP